jgi:hypothetical protein
MVLFNNRQNISPLMAMTPHYIFPQPALSFLRRHRIIHEMENPILDGPRGRAFLAECLSMPLG